MSSSCLDLKARRVLEVLKIFFKRKITLVLYWEKKGTID